MSLASANLDNKQCAASRIHQDGKIDSLLAIKLSSSSIPAQYNHGPLTQIAHRRESLNELRTVGQLDKMLDQPQVRFLNSWLFEWQRKIVENASFPTLKTLLP